LACAIADDEARAVIFDRPRGREVARGQPNQPSGGVLLGSHSLKYLGRMRRASPAVAALGKRIKIYWLTYFLCPTNVQMAKRSVRAKTQRACIFIE
jgi:hypothetical protein